MNAPKVLIADSISTRGIEELGAGGALEVVVRTGQSEAELVALIPDFSALVVRSQTKVTAPILQAATRLKVVGRAGVGVDNVDVEAATRRGMIVMNTPGGNTDLDRGTRFLAPRFRRAQNSAGACQPASREVGPETI